jgi:hypothetical protein
MHSKTFEFPIYKDERLTGGRFPVIDPIVANAVNTLADKAAELVRLIESCCPPCDDRTEAAKKVEEAVMWTMNGMRKNG